MSSLEIFLLNNNHLDQETPLKREEETPLKGEDLREEGEERETTLTNEAKDEETLTAVEEEEKIKQFVETQPKRRSTLENTIFHRRKHFKRQDSIVPHVNHNSLVENELELKIALYNHICSPLKRWKVGRIIPYKMILQFIKSVLVLVQVFLFAYTLANERAFFNIDTEQLMERLLLKNKGASKELYTKQEVVDEIIYTVDKYYSLPNITLGTYGHTLDTNGSIQPVLVTLREYRQADFDPSTSSIVLDYTVVTSTINITNENVFIDLIDDINWNSLIDISLLIELRNIHIVQEPDRIDCHHIAIMIRYSNAKHTGIITHSLQMLNLQFVDCNSQLFNHNQVRSLSLTIFRVLIDTVLIIICVISNMMAVIKYWRAFKLAKAMGEFYRVKLNIKLSWKERKSLFSLWLFFTMISNVLLVLGSALKIALEFNVTNFKSISVRFLLGSAVLIEAGTILRYISFFKELNALPRTLTYVLPDMLKFLLCTAILFFAFSICGSIIFAPFNERFSDFPNSLQSLFVLTNGDDIYPMFRSFDDTDNSAVRIYGQIFIYIFVSLFVYAVLNLFTSLIIKAHEQSQSVNRATVNEVRKFIYSGALTDNGHALCDSFHVHKWVDPEDIKNRAKSQTII